MTVKYPDTSATGYPLEPYSNSELYSVPAFGRLVKYPDTELCLYLAAKYPDAPVTEYPVEPYSNLELCSVPLFGRLVKISCT